MFSKTSEYALRALIYITQNAKNGARVNIKDIAKGIGSPAPFIAKILQDLSRKGIVQSAKGVNGGFYMSEENLQLSIMDVVKVIDGDKLFTGCGLGLPGCSDNHPCPIHYEFKHIKDSYTKLFSQNKMYMLSEEIHNNISTFLKY